MKQSSIFYSLLCISIFLFGCHKENERNDRSVYTLSNQAGGNQVMVFDRGSNGALSFKTSFSTGGSGTGATLGSQGALALSSNKQWMFAVNAGSNDISVLQVTEDGLALKDKKPSGGTNPISISNYNNLVYVLNAGADPNISGFYLGNDGTLTPIANSTTPLKDKAPGPAQISFANNGSVLVITEKTGNKIVSYNLSASGTPGDLHEITAASSTPFGFAVGNNGNIFVTEAGQGALSVYNVGQSSISLVDGPVVTNQKAACWAVITENGNFVYVANAASNSISGYRVSSLNHVTLLNASGVTAVTGSSPIDEALSERSRFLYVLNSVSHNISSFSVEDDGSLSPIGTAGTLPTGTVGLAAR